MTKPVLIFVHGVGNHNNKDFKKQCLCTLDWASTQYAKVPKPSESCQIESISYDDVFDKVLANARESAASGDMFSSSERNLVKLLAAYQDAIDKDDFWTENALDAYVQ